MVPSSTDARRMDELQAVNAQSTLIFVTILLLVWCPTDKMIADFLTKPLQGKAFVEFRDLLMGAV